jgi:hypothetical protein
MTDAPHVRKPRPRHYWFIILPLALIMLVLAGEELDNMGYPLPWRSDPCSLQEIDQSEFSTKAYVPLVDWALQDKPKNRDVAVIYINPNTEPSQVLTNTCSSRVFLSRLIYDLGTLNAQVVVIDKYYSNGSCTDVAANKTFLDAMDQHDRVNPIPIVVGQATEKLAPNVKSSGCLVLKEKFPFNDGANVHYGLTRLNSDTRKIPLGWTVLPENTKIEASNPPTETTADSISLVAARLKKLEIVNDDAIKRFLTAGQHPYTNFILDLPTINATAVACYAEAQRPYPGPSLSSYTFSQPVDDPCHGKNSLVDDQGNKLDLNGKIVVIGDKSDADMQPYPGGEDMPGTWFHANYIQSLLDGRFLREIPETLTIACLILFITIVYILFWRMEAQPVRALIISFVLFLALFALSAIILRKYAYFTPLWALWGGFLMIIFRFFETKGHHFSDDLQHKHSAPHK